VIIPIQGVRSKNAGQGMFLIRDVHSSAQSKLMMLTTATSLGSALAAGA
jgi:hypothetical protein